MKPIRVGLVDDHTLVRSGFAKLLEAYPTLKVCIEAPSGEEFLQKLLRHKVDVVFVDIAMPDMDGIELTQILNRDYKRIKVVGLSMHDDLHNIRQMMAAGARGYMLKSAKPPELVECVKQVHEGQIYFCSECKVVVRKSLADAPKPAAEVVLSPEEAEMIQMTVDEKSDAEMSLHFSVSLKTIAKRRQKLMLKLGVKTLAGLVKWGLSHALPKTGPQKGNQG